MNAIFEHDGTILVSRITQILVLKKDIDVTIDINYQKLKVNILFF